MGKPTAQRKSVVALVTLAVFICFLGIAKYGGAWLLQNIERRVETKKLAPVLAKIGESSRGRLKPFFQELGFAYPPPRVTFLALKDERRLEVYAWEANQWVFARSYGVQAASGVAGPKLQEGDKQVPEGIYHITVLNPASSYYLSMGLDYPNAFDRAMAQRDGRTDLGGDIYIHGKDVSVGCLAMGDEAIEELFTLVADVGRENVTVIIAPFDLRAASKERALPSQPDWTKQLYEELTTQLASYKR